MRCSPWLVVALTLSFSAWADAGLPQLPDGSVAEGGADRTNQEAEDSVGRTPTSCRASSECERGFVCDGGLCRYVGFRNAAGCGGGLAALWVAGVGVAVVLRRRAR